MVFQIPIDYEFYCELLDLEMSSYIPKEMLLETLMSNIRHTNYGNDDIISHDLAVSEEFTSKLINIMLMYPVDSNYTRVLDVCEYSIDIYVGDNYNDDRHEYKLYIEEPQELDDFIKNSCYIKNSIGSFKEVKDLVLTNLIREVFFDDYTDIDEILDFRTNEERDRFQRIIEELETRLEEEAALKIGNPSPITLCAQYTGMYGNAIGIKVTYYLPEIFYNKGLNDAKVPDTKLIHFQHQC